MQKQNKSVQKRILRECERAMRTPLILITISNLLTAVLYVATADVLGAFADAVFSFQMTLGWRNAVTLAICIFALVFVAPIFGLIGNLSMFKHSLRHDNVVFGRYLDMEPARARTFDAGEMQYELEDAPNSLRIYWVRILSQVIPLLVGWSYLLYQAGNVSWLLTGFMLAFTLLRLAISLFLNKKIKHFDAALQEYKGSRRAMETEITRKPDQVKLLGVGDAFLERINREYVKHYHQTENPYIKYQVFVQMLPKIFDRFSPLLFILVGGIMVIRKSVTPGELSSMIGYLAVMQILLTTMCDCVQNWPLMMNAVQRLCEIYEAQEDETGESVEYFTEMEGQNIACFFEEKRALSLPFFNIRSGEKVHIVGANGSGKTTLVKVICGLLREYRGQLMINHRDFRTINVQQWRKLISYAPQQPYIFSASIKENIALGNPAAAEEKVDTLIHKFGLDNIANRQISMGTELSGGERQKISIARALVRDTPILIFDEPANHLDRNSIDTLYMALMESNKTIILITHEEKKENVIHKKIIL